MQRFATFLMVVMLIAGCAGDEGSEEKARSDAPPIDVSGESRSAIPEEKPPPSGEFKVAAFADAEASAAELAVAPGEVFNVYTFAVFASDVKVNAVQYRLDLPEGVTIVGEEKTSPEILTMGQRTELFAMVFECRGSGTFQLMKYTCRAEDGFKGGDFQVKEGQSPGGAAFLGFATCAVAQPEQVDATGGSLALRLKS